MRGRQPRRLMSICCALLIVGHASSLGNNRSWSRQSPAAWTTFAPAGEEFAVMIPGLPVVRNWPISNNPTESKREKFVDHRDYSGYGSGLIFVIEAYQAEHPEELLKL